MRQKITIALCTLIVVVILFACSPAGGDNPGHEFMPDMGHSIAYEANTYDYYYYNRWGSEEDYYKMAQPRLPVKGTIARGNGLGGPAYYYDDTEEERTRAMGEITENPLPITDGGLARAEELYTVNCGVCHGAKGDGDGYLVSEENPNAYYPAQPANLLSDEFIAASEGRYYHSIIYGKNVMGSYRDKLSFEERWQVIHYIRSLQAKEKKLAYNELENTLNTSAKPYADFLAATRIEEKQNEAVKDDHEIPHPNNH